MTDIPREPHQYRGEQPLAVPAPICRLALLLTLDENFAAGKRIPPSGEALGGVVAETAEVMPELLTPCQAPEVAAWARLELGETVCTHHCILAGHAQTHIAGWVDAAHAQGVPYAEVREQPERPV